MKKIILITILVFVLLHFAKDITQDILKIPTFLDLMGDVREDLSVLPYFPAVIITAAGYLSFIVEIFLVISIPYALLRKSGRLEKIIFALFGSFIFYLLFVLLLDPRFKWKV